MAAWRHRSCEAARWRLMGAAWVAAITGRLERPSRAHAAAWAAPGGHHTGRQGLHAAVEKNRHFGTHIFERVWGLSGVRVCCCTP